MNSPLIARRPGRDSSSRLLPCRKGELIPLTLADWDAKAGTIDLVIQARRRELSMASTRWRSARRSPASPGRSASPQAAPLRGRPDVVFAAGGLGLPPVYPIMRAHLELGNHVTLIAGFRTAGLLFWTGEGRARRQAAGGVRRPAQGDLRQQRRHVRREGLRHRPARASC